MLLGVLFVVSTNYFAILIPQKIRDALDFVNQSISEYKTLEGAAKTTQFNELSQVLFVFSITIIGYVILQGLLLFMNRQTLIVNSRLIEYDLRKEIYAHFQTLDTAFYKRNKTGDLMARITEDVSKVRNYLGPGIMYGINLIALFSLTIFAMFRVNSTLAIYTLLPLPVLSISIYYVSDLINKKSTVIQQQLSRLTSFTQETFSGIRVLKSYGKEKDFSQHFSEECEDFRIKNLKLARVNALFYPLMILLINASTLLVLLVGGKQVAGAEVTVGNIAEFIIYVNMLTWPVTAIGWIASVIQEAEASQARINEFLFEKPEIKSGDFSKKQLDGNIEFRHVSLSYKDTGIRALNDLNFTIRPGEKIAIVGRTAAGKSSIAELLLRMYDPDEGDIFLDGHSLKDYNLSALRKRIAYVPQDVFLFSDSISNNISFGVDEEPSLEEIEKYAEYASVKKDIENLPKSFETRVGERGVTLSGGQKQRVSIARALLRNPDIVILDDCLSAVDTETEQRILQYLNTALKDKTCIIITHRLNSLMDIDKILVLESGEIVEMGKYEELAAADGAYSRLMESGRTSV
jgi:ATP-binding cassette, subfamily B, multidrug efflux pump